jgi:hypothetical protein
MKFKNAKMTIVPQKNPFPNTKVASTAEQVFSPFVVKNNKGSGPQGQTSRMQIKKIKEWSDWKMKDWIKAAIVAIVVIWIISWMTGGAA